MPRRDKIGNYVWLYACTEQDGYDIPVWYDDVVVATSYIGPIYTGTAGSEELSSAELTQRSLLVIC